MENVWQKTTFKIPLEHCECADPADHLANLNISIADRMIDEAPPHLRQVCEMGAAQPRRHRAVIARFGRHPHRNAVLRRDSTPRDRVRDARPARRATSPCARRAETASRRANWRGPIPAV
ncbi:DUF924 domain-containing protein [Mesorhizobium sp. YC-39]|uniref:DUF924 domain-containing protein n=1 Tax=Mesorhizobium sp. YC-2 TaxID=2986064 RepID=UPI0021E8889F|nr:DUF924 domain-containing protein [Mesorhizobium sp. YC-2]MCV3206483.1 DUF924 domain-containing protein [Mesorhizobium sp. YC-2]MCV3227117.1 DUF924 domain-containing protein [Mesorhizobium sp. YC-39]